MVRPKSEIPAEGSANNSVSPAAVAVTLDDATQSHSQIEPDAVSVPLMTQLEPTAEADLGTFNFSLRVKVWLIRIRLLV